MIIEIRGVGKQMREDQTLAVRRRLSRTDNESVADEQSIDDSNQNLRRRLNFCVHKKIDGILTC